MLHTAAEVVGVVITPTAKPHHLQRLKSFLLAFLGSHSLHLQAILHVFGDGLVGEQGEMLEHHAHLVAADFSQLLAVGDSDFFFVYEDPPGGGRYEAIDAPDERGFARPGEAHDHEYLALVHVKGRFGYRHHVAGLVEDILPGCSLFREYQGLIGGGAEDFIDVVHLNFGCHKVFSNAAAAQQLAISIHYTT